MPVPGYDPDDIDDVLESRLGTEQIENQLTDAELERYRAGDETLADLLDDEMIERTIDRGDAAN